MAAIAFAFAFALQDHGFTGSDHRGGETGPHGHLDGFTTRFDGDNGHSIFSSIKMNVKTTH
jgi:hypothetical protein